MRDFGSIQSPQNAFLLNLGLESLHVRMARHCENGLAVARFLKDHPKVSFVTYPGLEGDKYYEVAKKYMPNGTCGVVSLSLIHILSVFEGGHPDRGPGYGRDQCGDQGPLSRSGQRCV